MKRLLILLVALGLMPLGFARSTSIRNADLHQLGDSQNLQRDFAALANRIHEDAWVGYAVPMVSGTRHICCGSSDARPRVCHLESGNCNSYNSDDDDQQISGNLRVIYRLAGGEVQKIRSFSEDCELDAGGLPVYWWSAVNPGQSLDFLETQAQQQHSTQTAESAVQAIAHHGDPGANDLLENLALDRREDVAEQAVFWLGAVRGEGGFDSLKRLGETIEDIDLREQITFALYLSEAPGALPELIGMARNDENDDVRGQALFWLSQKAGRRAAATLAEAVEKDPDLEVKKKAVFGLSQLPADEGVPLLIEVAQTHRHPKVRKQAMFWLGQSGDERALAFFEKILLK